MASPLQKASPVTATKTLCTLSALCLALLLAAGYAGALHPAADSLAVFRPQIAALAALMATLALILGARKAPVICLLMAGVAGLPILMASVAQPTPAQGLLLYQKNMLFINADLPALQADIRAANPAILTLQEVLVENRPFLTSLADILPHQLHCPWRGVGGPAIATSLPPTAAPQICERGLAAMQVTGPTGPLWIVSIHLHWPWPYNQAPQVDQLIPILVALDGPIIAGGDFNMVPWSHTLHRFTAATGTQIAGPLHGTYAGFAPILLPIDHVLGPRGTTVTRRPLSGADHYGLLADIALQPPESMASNP
jgi:endonuclease/exonuclease/phosphatase (EEP) superfamily protein YafD